MKKLVRLTALIGVFVLASGAPAYARGGGGHGGGGGGHFGGGAAVGGGHAFGGPHGGFGGHHGFEGHHGFDGHRGFDGHHFDHDRFHDRAFIGFGPYWDPYWGYVPYGPYADAPSAPSVEVPPVYIEKPQAGYCPSGQANYPGVQSCAQPWMHVAPHAG